MIRMTTSRAETEKLRRTMLRRARAYCRERKTGLSNVGKSAVNDGTFFTDLEGGRNFTVATYNRVMDWFDANSAAKGASS